MPTLNIEILIGALLTATPTIIINLVQIFKARAEAHKTKSESKKIDTDATAQLVDTALSMNEPLKEENERLKQTLASCSIEKANLLNSNESLWKGARVLYNQIKEAGGEPRYELPPFPQNGTITKPMKKEKTK